MHRPIFGHSFAVLVALVLLFVLAFIFLNKKKTSTRRNAGDIHTGTSSLMTESSGNCYDVFLSFRGSDIRKGFIDHLYHGLIDTGIHAFRDDEELRQGENIRPELLAVIKNSKISIPILSVNYGTSNWCLDKLVQMMECKNNNRHIVLPIFYKVKPAEVRHQIGSFGDEYHKHERRLRKRRFDPMILEKWKKALLEVGALKGYEAYGYESELVKSIVQKVLSELKKKPELYISKNLVGIDGHVREVMKFMDNKSHATLFVGIHGMGGIGKTTLAKAIYNKLSSQFEHRSFIADIRESWERNGVHYLQNQLIYDISNQKNAVHNKDEGNHFISSRFKDKKVLVLLDDVDDVDQVKCLAGKHDWFSLGSRIIITTRNKEVLEEARVDYNYEHEVMDDNQSLILFSKHAFQKDSPLKEFEGLTREVVSITKGLPLSLEVLGSLLCGKNLAFWRDAIYKFKKVPPKEVQEKLRISIDALDYNQKQIFLDIACFFIDTDKNIASYMWDACDFFPEEEIKVLISMSLIKVDNDGMLKMHGQLRDLGREIVREENQREPWCRGRLWDYKEAQKVLKENKGTDEIEAINLSENNSKYDNEIDRRDGDGQDGGIYTGKQFKNLTNLRFLYMKKARLIGDFEDSLKGLKWLQWRECPASFEVKNFHLKELVALELQQSKINEKWEGWSFLLMAGKLKYLDLSYCLSLEDTKFLSALKKLEVLILDGCDGLKRIDASIGDMEALLRLELRSCQSLTELPTEIGNLKALQQLFLMKTSSLFALPNSIGCLENLEILNISWSGIEELPNGIGRLRKLRELDASCCVDLKEIKVKSMCKLSSLRRLDFNDSGELPSLPDFPSGLTYLGFTCRSRKLPSLSHLPHLKELRVSKCRYVECIQVLPSAPLKNSECSQLMDVEESESPQSLNTPLKLELLEVLDCHSLKTLDISQFIHLRTLLVCDCRNLPEVRSLDKLICLESLTIMMCDSIKWLNLLNFEGLKKLCVVNCKQLVEIQGLDRLEYLEGLDIKYCDSIERLDLPKSERLKELKATSCENLAEIKGLDRLKYLERLDISNCTSIGRLLISKFGRLKKLKAINCKNLGEIQGLDTLEFLARLDISKCIGTRYRYCEIADSKTREFRSNDTDDSDESI